ncbi:YcxB family protein [Streptomyces sp. NPDC005953]|uniref:YcxB family protein n=1 Tax=Streptomyces sp. NPDC005953 TaxID=3156719 RepID=UPI003403021E
MAENAHHTDHTGSATGAIPESVELAYRPVLADMLAGVLVQRRKTPSGRAQLVGWPLGALAAFAAARIRFDTTGRVTDPAAVMLVTGGIFLVVLTLFLPRLMARQYYRLTAEHGEYRAVLDERGVHFTAERFSYSSDWTFLNRYVETAEHFVLLTANKGMAGLIVLPKRGVQQPEAPTGIDALRALLDVRLRRI